MKTGITRRTHISLGTQYKDFKIKIIKKANQKKYTKYIESALKNSAKPTNVHIANKILTNAILNSDKENISKGKIRNHQKLLPIKIRLLIHERDKLRKQNHKDPQIDVLDRQIRDHKANIWKEKLNENWDHKTNTHILWNTIQRLQNKKPKQETNRATNFNNNENITLKEKENAFNKQFF